MCSTPQMCVFAAANKSHEPHHWRIYVDLDRLATAVHQACCGPSTLQGLKGLSPIAVQTVFVTSTSTASRGTACQGPNQIGGIWCHYTLSVCALQGQSVLGSHLLIHCHPVIHPVLDGVLQPVPRILSRYLRSSTC